LLLSYFLVGSVPVVLETAELRGTTALARRDQLRENWRLARAGERPERIAGLDAD
jgi:hypothetical protein